VGEGTNAIIVFHDIFGWNSGRIREICDQLADEGFRVILPDFFHGDCAKFALNTVAMLWNMPRMIKLIRKCPWKNIEKELQEVVYPYLDSQGVKKIGCIGFCWGGWTVVHASASDKISCGVSVHPSLQVGSFFGESVPNLINPIKSPQMFLPAGNDKAEVKKGGEAEKLLSKKEFGDQCKYVEFPAMKHGWVTRGDISQPEVARDVKRAVSLFNEFFHTHLSK